MTLLWQTIQKTCTVWTVYTHDGQPRLSHISWQKTSAYDTEHLQIILKITFTESKPQTVYSQIYLIMSDINNSLTVTCYVSPLCREDTWEYQSAVCLIVISSSTPPPPSHCDLCFPAHYWTRSHVFCPVLSCNRSSSKSSNPVLQFAFFCMTVTMYFRCFIYYDVYCAAKENSRGHGFIVFSHIKTWIHQRDDEVDGPSMSGIRLESFFKDSSPESMYNCTMLFFSLVCSVLAAYSL